MDKIPWYKHKTNLTALGGMITALGGYVSDEIGLAAFIASLFGGLAVIFGRQGIEKSGPSNRGINAPTLEQ